MKVVFDLKELLKYKNYWANICIKIGDNYYPEYQCNDLIFSVLFEWMYALMNMKDDEDIILGFIDGLDAIKLIKNKNQYYSAYYGIWDPFDEIFTPKSKVISDNINIDTFNKQMIETNIVILQFVKENKIKYPYIKHFIKMSEDFKAKYNSV